MLDQYLLNEWSSLLAYEPVTVPAMKEWRGIGGDEGVVRGAAAGQAEVSGQQLWQRRLRGR